MTKLDNIGYIKKCDASNMLKLIAGLPEQCREAYDIGLKSSVEKLDRDIRNIVFAGLGGSAIGADIIRIYLQRELKMPVFVSRNYTLPGFVNKDTLLFCSSYSGNTEETLVSFEDGLKRGPYIITLGSGGKLKELSLRNNFRHVAVPSGFPPRTALGYMSMTVLAILYRLGLINDKQRDVEEVYAALSELRDTEIGIGVPLKKNISKSLAHTLRGRYCIIYGTSDSTEAVAVRWRGQIAENGKSLSSSHVLPEMNHNEIVGWEFPKKLLAGFRVIILSDKNDHPRTKERIRVSKTIIARSGAELIEIKKDTNNFLARTYSLIYIGDFMSFYLAVLNGIDPMPVKQVDYLKSELAKI